MAESRRLSGVLIQGLLCAAALPGAGAAQDCSGKIDLHVLYAGKPGSAREGDFAALLRKHFRNVTIGGLAKFQPRSADGFDVIILDYPGKGFEAPRVRFPREYSRPTITIGVVGGLIGRRNSLKTGYL